jgi:hypothetical protein
MKPRDTSFCKSPPQISDCHRPNCQRSTVPWRWPMHVLDRGAVMTKKAKTTRISDGMKVLVVKKQNPYKPGTEIFKRGQYVLNAHGKTIADAKKGRDGSIVRHMLNHGFIKLVKAAD